MGIRDGVDEGVALTDESDGEDDSPTDALMAGTETEGRRGEESATDGSDEEDDGVLCCVEAGSPAWGTAGNLEELLRIDILENVMLSQIFPE